MSLNPILRSDPGGFRAVGSTGNSRTTPRWERAEWASASRLYVPPDAVPDTTDDLEATGVDTGAPTVGSPALTQAHVLTATGVATGSPSVGSPALGQVHVLAATSVAAGAPSTGTPALTQAHVLVATGVAAGGPGVGSPALGQIHVLAATGIASAAPTVGSPLLIEIDTSDGAPYLLTRRRRR